MSKIKTEKNRDNRRDIELPPNVKNETPTEVDEQTGAEKLLMASQPYWSVIALGLLICILGWVIVSYLMQNSREASAQSSRQLTEAIQQFSVSGNVDSLKQMKTDFPNEKATSWAMMVAGDFELNRGLSQFASDREGAIKLIKRSKESFQTVVDSPSSAKTTMQERSSLYSLAYANESLGDFKAAKELYGRIVKEAPDSIFAKDAQNGLDRVNDPAFVKLHDQFVSYVPAEEEAPGAVIPDKPNIDFPNIDIPKDSPESSTGGDFDPAKEMKTEEVAKPETGITEVTTEAGSAKKEPVETGSIKKESENAGSGEATEVPMTEIETPATEIEIPATEVETPATEVETPATEVEIPATEIKDAVDSVEGGVKEVVGEATETVTESAVDGVKDVVDSAKEVVEEVVTEGADK